MAMRTSESHPLRIDSVRPGMSTGLIGMTFCPGKTDHAAMSGAWERDLDLDLATAVRWGASAIVSLIEEHEFQALKVPGLGNAVVERGMKWFHLPIPDFQPPGSAFRQRWVNAGREIKAILDSGHNIVIHCKGGLGRTGTIAAQLLVEYGNTPDDAIDRVRQARGRESIETSAQEEYIRGLVSGDETG